MTKIQTVYERRAAEAWHLAHTLRLPMKNVAAKLHLPVSDAYELLAFWKSRRDVAEIREISGATFKISPGQSIK